jgi:hypothetical protein
MRAYTLGGNPILSWHFLSNWRRLRQARPAILSIETFPLAAMIAFKALSKGRPAFRNSIFFKKNDSVMVFNSS